MRQTKRTHSGRRALPATLLLVLASLLLGPHLDSEARIVEDRAKNYSLELPDGWLDDTSKDYWKDQGIVYGAVRALTKLRDGSPSKGLGAELAIAVTIEPKNATGGPKFADIDALANDKETQAFLMNRFDSDPSKWPEVEVLNSDYDDGFPMRVVRAKGESRNLLGRASPTIAVMLLAVAQGQIIRCRMYGWTTEYDDEGVKADLDVIEINFDIVDRTIKKEKPEPPPGEGPGEEEEETPEQIGDRDEEKVFRNKVFGWELTKPKGIKSKKFDREKYENAVAWFEDSNQFGSYQIILYVFKKGGAQQDINVKEWALDKWWTTFSADHPEGAIWTLPFPKRSRRYLTLPEFANKVVVFEDPKKRPEEMKSGDLIKKKIAEKVKGAKVGKVKASPAYRAVLAGVRPRSGKETLIRYAWTTPKASCTLIVSLSRRADEKWGRAIQQMIGSIGMLK